MKEKISIMVLLVLFIVILIFVNKLLENQNVSYKETNTTILNSSDENESMEENNMEEIVLEVTNENFEEEVLKSDKIVLVDFYADWCGPCKMLSPIVEEVAKENTDIKCVRLNIDNAEKIAIDYGVMSIPTLVVIKNGKEETRSVGLISKSQVLELIKK